MERWFAPCLARWARAERRVWAPLSLGGRLGPGERKSIEPVAARVAPGQRQALHHFGSISPWEPAPLEAALGAPAQALVGGPRAVLIVDDTALVRQGRHAVGGAQQYCGAWGKEADGQALVSLTLARGEGPVPSALRLFLPETGASNPERRQRVHGPEDVICRPQWGIAPEEIARGRAQGARCGCVFADAGYGSAAEFRPGLSARGLLGAVGILPAQQGYAAEGPLAAPVPPLRGRPQTDPVPSETRRSAQEGLETPPPEGGSASPGGAARRESSRGPVPPRGCASRRVR